MQIKTHSKIAVIGAGVMGLMSAYALARRGYGVTLYDPAGFPAHNASFIAGGMLAPYAEIEHMTPDFIGAAQRSIALWQEILPQLPHTTTFAQQGSLFIAHDQDRYILERFAAHLPPEAQAQRLDQTAMQALEPQTAERFPGGLFLEGEAHIHPEEAMRALCAALESMDHVCFVQEVASPEDLSRQFDHVLDCRGYNAEASDPELRGVKGEMAIVENKDFALSRPLRLMHPRYPLYIVPRADHVFMIGATQIETASDARVSVRSGLELLSALYSLHPSFGDAHIISLQAGIRPAYADNLPRIKRQGNIIRCNGLFRHGFLLSPMMAKTACDMIAQKNDTAAPLFTRDAA